jgi:hypothetical protein
MTANENLYKEDISLKYFFILVVFLLFSGNSYAQSYLNFPIDTLASDSFYNYRADIKYDVNGFYHIVNSRQFHTASDTREIFYWTNKTGPVQKIRVTNNAVDDNYTAVGFDWQNKVHIGWERRDAGNIFQLIYANDRQIDGDFSNTVWITTGGINKATPYMAVGKDSIAHFVYYTFVAGQDNAYYRTYNFVTGQLGSEVTLGPGEASGENDIEAAVDGLNKVHVVYTTNAVFGGGALMYFNNESGSLVSIPTGLGASVQNPDITIDNNNTVHIIYKLSTDNRIYLISRPSGGSFTSPVAIVPPSIGNPVFWRGIDTDSTGRIYVSYAQNNSAATKGFFLVHGTGSSFSAPIMVFQDSTSSYSTNGSTSITAKGSGQIAVCFGPAGSRFGNVISDIFLKQGTLTVTGITDPVTVASGYKLFDNYPNPFNPTTNIEYILPKSGNVKLAVYDLNGKLVSTLVDRFEQAGEYSINFNAGNLTTGVYFYKLQTDEFEETKKMVLVK